MNNYRFAISLVESFFNLSAHSGDTEMFNYTLRKKCPLGLYIEGLCRMTENHPTVLVLIFAFLFVMNNDLFKLSREPTFT